MVPPNGWTSGAHAIVNVVNKRENYTTSGWHQGPSKSRRFFRNKKLLFILVLATDQGNNGAVRGLWSSSQGFIYVYHIMSPVVFFSCWKWLAQFYFFLKKYPNKAYLLYRPCWAANLSRRGEIHSVCQEMDCTFLKHIKPGISFNFFFITRSSIPLIFMRGQLFGFYIYINYFSK